MRDHYEEIREERIRYKRKAYIARAKIFAVTLIILMGIATLNYLDRIMTEQANLTYRVIVLQTEIDDLSNDITEKVQSVDLMDKVAVQGAHSPTHVSYGTFSISHYCQCTTCCGKDDGITATGTQATADRTIAVDPSVIPLGAEVVIDGQSYIAEDVGEAIKGNKIDIFTGSHEETINRGRITREVFIKEETK